eukprot:754498-Hanusia_phi.AAC.2
MDLLARPSPPTPTPWIMYGVRGGWEIECKEIDVQQPRITRISVTSGMVGVGWGDVSFTMVGG